jgi:excisionase family DNA binding protein
MQPQPTIYTTEQVCKILQISRQLLYAEMREGNIAAFKVGRSYRITRQALDEFMKKMAVKPGSVVPDETEDQKEEGEDQE